MAKEIKLPELFSKKSQVQFHREINLVPEIKYEMIKALKLRNFIFFLCIVVAIASVSITLIFGAIVGGQKLVINNNSDTIDTLSNKLNSYSELNEFLTIKGQLDNISTITDNKKVFSRTFDVLTAMIPTGADRITISELSVNLSEPDPTFNLEAQADAGTQPFIDYRVLDAFQKSMQYLKYDYGEYVDRNGDTIPAYCMIESDDSGAIFRNDSKDIYAYWTINADGCAPASNNTSSSTTNSEDATTTTQSNYGYETEEYNGQTVVRIWRTPQASEWYKSKKMTTDGAISGVPHFNSACVTYSIDDSQPSEPKLIENDNICPIVPDGAEGIEITESSNGRDASNNLVLRFAATITLDPNIYTFEKSHFIAIPPAGRYNVTDSYVQIQSVFGERAADCAEDDADCKNNTTNTNGGN